MRQRPAFAIFLPLAILATCLCGLLFIGLQQGLRSAANDPQQQLAEDAAARLTAGASPASVVAGSNVDVSTSLAPFIVVYDRAGGVLATDGTLDGRPPVLPAGVLRSAQSSGLDVITWQPQAGLRIATVSLPWSGGVVTAGRSLRLVEDREAQTGFLVVIGWLATLVALGLSSLVAAAIRDPARTLR